ncbi:MAG: hypothetical protein ABI980_03175 [Nitrospirota bacterium]
MLAHENFYDLHVWHNKEMLQRDAQNGRPVGPQPVKGEAHPLQYVEAPKGTRTKQAYFFSILPEEGS